MSIDIIDVINFDDIELQLDDDDLEFLQSRSPYGEDYDDE